MKKLFLSVILCIIFTTPVLAAEPVLKVRYGQTVIEDINHPDNNEITKAEAYLSENHIELPSDIRKICETYGKKYNIAPELLEAIIWKESWYISDIIDKTGTHYGLMQVNRSVHAKRMEKLGVTDLLDPESNIAVGSDYLAELLNENDLETAIMLYNGDQRARIDDFQSGYCKKILEVSRALEIIHFK